MSVKLIKFIAVIIIPSCKLKKENYWTEKERNSCICIINNILKYKCKHVLNVQWSAFSGASYFHFLILWITESEKKLWQADIQVLSVTGTIFKHEDQDKWQPTERSKSMSD